MSKFLKLASPAICLIIVIYLSLHISEIKDNISAVLGTRVSAESQQIKQLEEELFANEESTTVSVEYADTALHSIDKVDILSEDFITLANGEWLTSENPTDIKRYVLKTNSIVDTLIAVDSLNLYVLDLTINELDGTLELIVRVGGSN